MQSRGVSVQNNNRPIYSFPELRTPEILQCMEDLRIPINEAELSKPTPATVQRVFEAFADIFMGINKDQIGQQSTFAVTESLEFPDLHVDSIGLVTFYQMILRLMLEVGIEDFSLRDLIRPESPRLRLILSAVINFAKFREEQLAVFEEFSRRADEAMEQRIRLVKRDEDLTHKINLIKSRRADEEPAVNRLKEESSRMMQTLREYKKEQTALSADLDGIKARRTEYSEKLIISEMNASINNEKSNLSQLERKSRELQMKLDALVALEQELAKTVQGIENLAADLKKKDEVLMRCNEDRDAIERQQILAKDLAIQETQLNRQMSAAQDKLSRLQNGQAERRDRMGQRLRTLQQEYQTVADERSRAAAKIDQSEKIVKDFELRISELRRSHEAEVAAIRTDSVALKARVISYMNDLKKHLRL